MPERAHKLDARMFTIGDGASKLFQNKFDQVQQELETLASMDALLSGMCECGVVLFLLKAANHSSDLNRLCEMPVQQ